MSAYHKKRTQAAAIGDLSLPIQDLPPVGLQEIVKSRFSSFYIALGIKTLMGLIDQDVEALARPKGKHNPNRAAYRHGY